MIKFLVFGLMLTSVLCVGNIYPQTPEKEFEEANSFFQKGDYSSALEKYEGLVSKGFKSKELYFNLGLTFSRLGETGNSILYLEKARKYDKNNQMIAAAIVNENLKIRERIAKVPEFFIFKFFNDMSGIFGVWTWFTLMIILYILALALAASFILKYRYATIRNTLIAGSVLFLGLVAAVPSFILSREETADKKECIVLSSQIEMFSIPEKTEEKPLMISAGNKLEILETISGWYRVLLPNGKTGWIQKEGTGQI